MEPEGSDKQPSRLLLLVQNMQGYLNLCELLARAWTRNAQRAQAWIKWDWLDELSEGLIALSGADGGVGRHGAAGRRRGARAGAGAAPGAVLRRGASTSSCSAPAWPRNEAHVRARGGAGGAAAAAGGGHAPGAVPRRRRLRGARGAGVHRRRRDAGQPAARQALLAPSSTSRRRRRWRRCSPTCRRRWPTACRSRSAATCSSRWASRSCRTSRSPTAWRCEEYFRKVSRRRPGAAPGAAATPTRPSASAQRPRYAERLEFEIVTILKMGFPGYFLIVSDFIKWAHGQRLPGGPGARLGRRLAGGLFAVHHRPGPAAIQPAVRALPEPRARVDARLRHRLLPGQPRTRHRLRQGQVRPRRGQPDRHLRHHGRQGRAARRRPRARHGLRPCRQHRQAGAGAAGQAGDAGSACPTSPTRA